MELTRVKRAERRRAALFNERSSWMAHWREISEYQQPRAGRFVVTDRNRGEKRHNAIYDNTALYASRTLAAGMMSGMTSPARPWFKLALPDRDLMEFGPVKTWLHRTGVLLREVFASSNTYRSLHAGYNELGLFGTWATTVLEDYHTVLHHYPLTIGEYALGTDHRGVVNTLAREFQMTTGQMAAQFGMDRLSPAVRNLVDRGNLDAWITIYHLVEPNEGRDPRKLDNRNMRWSSLYYEAGQDNQDRPLGESGFKRFPTLAPRWEVHGQDIYGESPGMSALGDVKQLQFEQLRKAQGIDYQSNPPIQVPTAYKDAARARLPGGVLFVDSAGQNTGIRNAFDVPIRLDHLLLDIQDVRERIRSAYYADLFLMLANDTRSGVTATEVAERHEEKMLMLGPVLERLHNELLSPMIDMAFDRCADAGILPEPPPELEGMDLNIEFISTLAQAQRMVSAAGVDRLLGTIGSMANIFPEARDKIDIDQVVDDYGEMFGVNPEIIVPDDRVAEIRAARAQQQAAAQAVEAAPAMAGAARDLSQADGVNMRNILNQFQGYGTPSPADAGAA